MKPSALRTGLLLAALVASSRLSAADSGLVKYKEWAKSPEFVYLASDDERKAWKSVATDAEAEKLVALFWARRDPDPKTEVNELRQRFEALVKLADEHFSIVASKTRGSLTERGKLFVLVGPPKTLSSVAGDKAHAAGFSGVDAIGQAENAPGTTIGESIVTFTYEAKQLPEWAGIKSLVAKFAVEQSRDSVISAEGEVRRLENAAVKAALKSPQLTEAPVFPAGGVRVSAIVAKPGETPAPVVSAAAVAALEAALAKEPFGALTVLPVTHADGRFDLTWQTYLAEGAPAREAWLVRSKDGAEVTRAEEPVSPQKSLEGVVSARAIPISPGEYDVAVVLLDAAGNVLLASHRRAAVAAASAELRSSPLFLAVGELPAEAGKTDAPFVFAGRRFVSRGDGRVTTKDGLTYVVRLYGPGVDPATKKALVKPRVKIQPKGKKPLELPAAPDEPVAVVEGAKGQPPILDVAGTVADADIGTYFKPGEYVFIVSIEDAVRNVKLELSEPFTIVAPEK